MTGNKTYFVQQISHSTSELWLQWWCSDATAGEGALEHLVAEFAEHEVVLLLPGAKVRSFEVMMPKLREATVRQALPFAMEDELAEDPDQCHFAIFAYDAQSGQVNAGVTNADELTLMIAPLQAAGVNLIAAVPDYLLLSWAEGSWSVVVDNEWCRLRYGQWQGFTVPTKDLELALAALTKQVELPLQLQVTLLGGLTESWFAELVDSSFSLLGNAEKSPRPNFVCLPLIYDWTSPLPNLLQGSFKPKAKTNYTARLWQATAIAWLSVAILFMGGKFYQYHVLTKQNTTLQQQILTQYQRVFPGALTANSPRIVFERELQQVQQGASEQLMLSVMAALGDALAEQSGATLENLTYQEDRLVVSVSLVNFTALERLVENLQQHGLQVKKDEATAKGQRVQARLQITRGGA